VTILIAPGKEKEKGDGNQIFGRKKERKVQKKTTSRRKKTRREQQYLLGKEKKTGYGKCHDDEGTP